MKPKNVYFIEIISEKDRSQIFYFRGEMRNLDGTTSHMGTLFRENAVLFDDMRTADRIASLIRLEKNSVFKDAWIVRSDIPTEYDYKENRYWGRAVSFKKLDIYISEVSDI